MGRHATKRLTSQFLDLHMKHVTPYLRNAPATAQLKWKTNGTERASIGIQIESDNPTSLTLVYDIGTSTTKRHQIRLETTPCHLGGERYWFLCPACHERKGVLYGGDDHWLCRVCRNLTYPSQREQNRSLDRIRRRMRALIDQHDLDVTKRQWQAPDMYEPHQIGRPKNMHYSTWDNITSEWYLLRHKAWSALHDMTAKLDLL